MSKNSKQNSDQLETEQEDQIQSPDLSFFTFPWLSTMAALLIMVYLVFVSNPEFIYYYPLPQQYTGFTIQWILLTLFMIALLWDISSFNKKKARLRQTVSQFKLQLIQLWKSKKQLQSKAHIYASHADKLKLFISDKLLEYIEYDEKFLHFQSIAAEVRHNGVISFDTVMSTLKEAELFIDEIISEDHAGEVVQLKIHSAEESLRYLWDLLDLSTTDNIAMHISNYLCECEEYYYQALLSQEENAQPYLTTYSPRVAILKTLSPLLENPILDMVENNVAISIQDDPQFRVYLEPVPLMLGNMNHLILLLENLFKNAQFFANKIRAKQKTAPILILCRADTGSVVIEVYNRGPHIDEVNKDQLFQLGFSTRRTKEHHGKGLGLYFVNEIVRGYDGHIVFHNIQNEAEYFTIRFELAGGEVQTHSISTLVDDLKPLCQLVNHPEPQKQLEWEFDSQPLNIEITQQTTNETHRFSIEELESSQLILDPASDHNPTWALEVKKSRKQFKVIFTPIDMNGVKFTITLPDVESRLEGDELPDELSFEEDVNQLNRFFKTL